MYLRAVRATGIGWSASFQEKRTSYAFSFFSLGPICRGDGAHLFEAGGKARWRDGLSGATAGAHQVQPAQFSIEVRPLDAQDPGGIGDPAVVMLQDGGDVVVLEPGAGLAKVASTPVGLTLPSSCVWVRTSSSRISPSGASRIRRSSRPGSGGCRATAAPPAASVRVG